MAEHYGPSLALESKKFHAVFGDDAFLLEAQNAILTLMRDVPERGNSTASEEGP
jgi:hypothetical protein